LYLNISSLSLPFFFCIDVVGTAIYRAKTEKKNETGTENYRIYNRKKKKRESTHEHNSKNRRKLHCTLVNFLIPNCCDDFLGSQKKNKKNKKSPNTMVDADKKKKKRKATLGPKIVSSSSVSTTTTETTTPLFEIQSVVSDRDDWFVFYASPFVVEDQNHQQKKQKKLVRMSSVIIDINSIAEEEEQEESKENMNKSSKLMKPGDIVAIDGDIGWLSLPNTGAADKTNNEQISGLLSLLRNDAPLLRSKFILQKIARRMTVDEFKSNPLRVLVSDYQLENGGPFVPGLTTTSKPIITTLARQARLYKSVVLQTAVHVAYVLYMEDTENTVVTEEDLPELQRHMRLLVGGGDGEVVSVSTIEQVAPLTLLSDGEKKAFVHRGLSSLCMYVSSKLRAFEESSHDGGDAETKVEPYNSCEDPAYKGLTDAQSKAMCTALASPVSLLSGTAGTGKTYTTARIVLAQLASCPVLHVHLSAPTGIAAKRLYANVLKLSAGKHALMSRVTWSTTHMLVYTHNGCDGRCKVCSAVILHVVVDESSLIDLNLALAIARATTAKEYSQAWKKLMFVGDPFQLPSISAGNVFFDMLHSGVFFQNELTEILRQAGDGTIVSNSRVVYETQHPGKTSEFDCSQGDFQIIIDKHPVSVAMRIAREDAGINNTMVIGQLNANVARANKSLQVLCNNNGRRTRVIVYNRYADKLELLVGDPVVFIANYIEEVPSGDRVDKRRFVNGQQGIVIGGSRGTGVTLRLDDGKEVTLETKDVSKVLAPFYCGNVFKTQGNEFDNVVVMLDFHARLQHRALLFTGITRAKKQCTVVAASLMTLYNAMKNEKKRKSYFETALVLTNNEF
jgi:hypothetical protein